MNGVVVVVYVEQLMLQAVDDSFFVYGGATLCVFAGTLRVYALCLYALVYVFVYVFVFVVCVLIM